MLRCVGPRLSGSSAAGCFAFAFTAQWKPQTRARGLSLAVAGSERRPHQSLESLESLDNRDTNEKKVQSQSVSTEVKKRMLAGSRPQLQRRVLGGRNIKKKKKVRWVLIKTKTPRRRKLRVVWVSSVVRPRRRKFRTVCSLNGDISEAALQANEICDINRHTQQIQRALGEKEYGRVASNEVTALLSDSVIPLEENLPSQLATSASSTTPLLPVEYGDLSAFAEDLSRALNVEPEEEVEPTDDWDLAKATLSQLPSSPLMDSGSIAARDKHRQPKSDPLEERTEFQSLLEKNPYAIALASPVRRCPVTKVALPKFFLQNFGMLRHPETDEPHLVPRGMFTTSDPKQPDGFRTGVGMSGPGMYTLARYPLLQAMKSGDGGFGKDPYLRVFPTRMKEKRATHLILQTKIREDMPEFILEQARRRIVSLMKYLEGNKAAYMASYNTWDDAKTWSRQVGAFLWTGSRPDAANEPPEFATLEPSERPHTDKDQPNHQTRPVKKGKIPVYNLEVLLGEEKMDELRSECWQPTSNPPAEERSSKFDAPIVTLKHRRPTTALELQLWWLQGFLAEHKNFLVDIEVRELALREERDAEIEASIERNNAFRSKPKI